MKKFLTVLCGGIIAVSLFAGTGTIVKAETTDPLLATGQSDDCGCGHEPITGPERNKIVAGLLSSEEFKAVKKQQLQTGYTWSGAHTIQVILPGDGRTFVGVPFVSPEGTQFMFVFINGTFVGSVPLE